MSPNRAASLGETSASDSQLEVVTAGYHCAKARQRRQMIRAVRFLAFRRISRRALKTVTR
jgi:hypothetical protein